MDLPTYTNIWRIEKRLYKLYDFRLPMPLPLGQIAVFTAIVVPYVIILAVLGVPFSHTLLWLYVLPPGVLTWFATRPVLENKKLPELIVSQVRYLSEPRTWCRLVPLAESDEVLVTAKVWRSAAAVALEGQPEGQTEGVAEAEIAEADSVAGAGDAEGISRGRRRARSGRGVQPRRWARPDGIEAGSARSRRRAAPPIRARVRRPARVADVTDMTDMTDVTARAALPPAPQRETAVRKPAARKLAARKPAAREPALSEPAVREPAVRESAAPSVMPDRQVPVAQAPPPPLAAARPYVAWPSASAAQRPARAPQASDQSQPPARQTQLPARQTQLPARQAQPPARQAQPPARQAQPPARQAQPPARQRPVWPDAPAVHARPGPAVPAAPGAVTPAGPDTPGPVQPGVQRPAAQKPGTQRPAAQWPGTQGPRPTVTVTHDRSADRPPRKVEHALGSPAERRPEGWRERVVVVPGGHRPGQPDQLQRDRARARLAISGPRRIVVLGCTVGAGQTVTTLRTGEMLASLRDEAVAVLDLNPGRSSLLALAKADPVLNGDQRGGLDSTPRPSQLEVIAAPADPGEQGNAPEGHGAPADASRVFELMSGRYPLILADPAAATVPRLLSSADQLVLVAPASPEAASAIAMTMEWLEAHGHAGLALGAITVLNGVSKQTAGYVEQAEAVAVGRCRAIVRVPWDDQLKAVQQTPGQQTPGHQTPGHQTPGQQTPGQQTPGHEAPGEQAPIYQAPVPHGAGQQRGGQLSAQAERAYTALAGVLVASLVTAPDPRRTAS